MLSPSGAGLDGEGQGPRLQPLRRVGAVALQARRDTPAVRERCETPPRGALGATRGLNLGLLGIAMLACGPGSETPTPLLFRGSTMGTTYVVTVVADLAEREAELLGRRIERALSDIDGKMSTYDPDSEISRLSRSSSTDWTTVSSETFEVLALAQRLSRLTHGAFDVTVAPLVDLWGFGPAPGRERPPTDEEVTQARSNVGFEHLQLDAASTRVRKTHPDLRLDLSALAKGYGVDQVARTLDDAGLEAYLIEVGGEVRSRGRRADGGAWRVGIERPVDGPPEIQRVVRLSGESLATSGDYRNYLEYDGRRYSHTIDPRTGYPVTHRLASVSVVDESCAVADARATALEVLGPDDGYRLATAEGWAAVFLVRDGDGRVTERSTPAFARLEDERAAASPTKSP